MDHYYYVVADTRGRILSAGMTTACALDRTPVASGQTLTRVDSPLSPDEWYLLDGKPAPRPAHPGFDRVTIRADGGDIATCTGLPSGATILLADGTLHAIDDGVAEFVTKEIGDHPVAIEAWPYRQIREVITAR